MIAVPSVAQQLAHHDDSETIGARTFERAPLAEAAREYSKINNLRVAWDIARQWLIVAASVAFVVYVGQWWAWVLAAIVIASRQQALLTLMHEAAHFHMFTNRHLGDAISDIFCAFPLNITTAGYRYEHAEHHRHTNTPQDPYWRHAQRDSSWHFPRTKLGAFGIFMGDVVGLFAKGHLQIVMPWTFSFRSMGKAQPPVTGGETVRYVLWIAGLATFLTLTGGWLYYLLLWLVPALTVMMAFFRVRALAEHPFTPAGPDETLETRDTVPTLVERFFIAPFNTHYHLTHHLFPSVPYYHLPAMHHRLSEHGLHKTGSNRFASYFHGEQSAMASLTVK